jgi:catechol 2,3-dioxygenase-like lactoylglutathione lyase family enzyme
MDNVEWRNSMTEILNLAEAALYVADLEKARAFYREVLGLVETAVFDDAAFLQTGPDSTLILFQIDKLESRESVIPAHGARGRGHVALAIDSDGMAAWHERLKAHGVDIEHEQDWPLGTYSLYFRDPDENSLELIDSSHYPQVWAKFKKE